MGIEDYKNFYKILENSKYPQGNLLVINFKSFQNHLNKMENINFEQFNRQYSNIKEMYFYQIPDSQLEKINTFPWFYQKLNLSQNQNGMVCQLGHNQHMQDLLKVDLVRLDETSQGFSIFKHVCTKDWLQYYIEWFDNFSNSENHTFLFPSDLLYLKNLNGEIINGVFKVFRNQFFRDNYYYEDYYFVFDCYERNYRVTEL